MRCSDMGCSDFDMDAVVQVKQEMAEVSQAGRRDKRQVQKLQLELLQAKQLLEKLRGNKQVIPISVKAVLRNSNGHSLGTAS